MGILKDFLTVPEQKVRMGEVTGRNRDGTYSVLVQGRTLSLMSMDGTHLNVGSLVAVVYTEIGWQIVGESTISESFIQEVSIDG